MILKGLLVESPKVAAAVSSSSSSTKGSLMMRLTLGCHKNQACHEASSKYTRHSKTTEHLGGQRCKTQGLKLIVVLFLSLLSESGYSTHYQSPTDGEEQVQTQCTANGLFLKHLIPPSAAGKC